MKIMFGLLVFLLLFCSKIEEKKENRKEEAIKLQKMATIMMIQNKNNLPRQALIDSAIALLDKSFETDTTYYYALENKVRLLQEKREFSEAIDVMKKILVVDPGNAKTALNLGFLFDYMKDHQNAQKYYNHAIQLFREKINAGTVDESYNQVQIGIALILLGKENEGKDLILKYKNDPEVDYIVEGLEEAGWNRNIFFRYE